MTNTRKAKRKPAPETIARRADEGKDVSRFFTDGGRMVSPVQRVNVDFTAPMLEELDRQAQELNISRQAVIKTLYARDSTALLGYGRPPSASESYSSARLIAIGG